MGCATIVSAVLDGVKKISKFVIYWTPIGKTELGTAPELDTEPALEMLFGFLTEEKFLQGA